MSDAWSQHVSVARAAWPTLTWEVGAYRAWLCALCGGEAELDAQLVGLDPAETLLCWRAALGDAEAHRQFDLRYMNQIAPALRRFQGDASFIDEVAQRVRVKLLVAPAGGPAPIGRYALAGDLGGLVRTVAIREALTLRRIDKPPSDQSEPLDLLVGESDPELRALKDKYAREFQRALAAAVDELTPLERHLLRLNLSARASIDDIARMHQTHRATAARWLNAARDRLAEATRDQLRTALDVEDDELQSLLRLIRSEAPRLLASIPPERDD